MSIKLMSKAWELDLSQGEKLVLLALCDHANDDGVCYPSQAFLASKCSMSYRSVINQIKRLESCGILTSERRQKAGSRQSNSYTINLDNYKSQCENSAHAESAHANFAHANSAPTNVQNTTELCANSAHSFKEEPSINHQLEPSIYKPTSQNKKRVRWDESLNMLIAEGIDEQIASDFIAIRKAKNAPLTQTALEGILREANKAGLTLENALRICIERNWQGFSASWLFESHNQTQSTKPSVKDIPKHTEGGVQAWL
ncbi:helix-turn-helix domain-containing protein [Snodgrassella sp. ESL0323]|uniref:helix-turn-helix domain-containing protein n=1 Tax=Snodgrassella sp. ESL0323 TaxID=2705034 RepID=UPI001583B001|nr:helix-turn-helix domain-containing protein [Snodgrassella sp. ESL0323]NUF79310.1 helix-turn-helix domain-containing protein [Snodgrassella sp. ESL0323]